MSTDAATVWTVILALAVTTYGLRLSFLGLLGGRALPRWALRLLRYTAVGVIPGLMAPLVLFPAATGGQIDPMRVSVAGVVLAVGWWTGSLMRALFTGSVALVALMWMTG
jgi:branched-subunit amino acid transport protein